LGTYFYDGEGKRVKKVTNTETTIFVYSGGKEIAEYSTLAPPAIPTTNYTTTDTLGSPRVITDAGGTVISRRDFMPFGEEIATDGSYRTTGNKYGLADSVRQKFTSYERDAESDLDFAQARYYNKQHGRFTSVDPSNLQAKLDISTPQSWNAYAYVNNQPTRLTDPTGKCGWKFWQCIANKATCGRFSTDNEIEQEANRHREDFKSELLEYNGQDVRGKDWSQVSDAEILGIYDGLIEAAKNGNVSIENSNNAVEAHSTPELPQIEPPDIDIPMQGGTRSNPNNIRSQMPKVPSSLQRVGRAINWGQTEQGAINRIQSLTRQEVVNSGVTRAEAEAARDFYKQVFKADTLNKTAQAREELMQKVIDFISGR
jgi:RHS repeat-associated protein